MNRPHLFPHRMPGEITPALVEEAWRTFRASGEFVITSYSIHYTKLYDVSLAPLFRPQGIVMHGGYSDWLYDFRPEAWLEGAKRTFSEVTETAERMNVDIYLENVFDEVPDNLLRLRVV